MASAATESGDEQSKGLIAPVWNLIVILLLLAIPVALGTLRLIHSAPVSPQSEPVHPANLWMLYGQTLIYEWILFCVVWIGLRSRNNTLRDLIGGHWTTTTSVVADFAVGAVICIAMFSIGDQVSAWLDPANGSTLNVIPRDSLDMTVWVALSVTAGIVEEVVFRGYLQVQLARLGLPALGAVAAQTVVFAAGHLYEGLNAVTVITIYGLLYGLFAVRLRSLRPLIIAHVAFDIVAILHALS
ncbi:MAG TPA: type II CAAX endopeptidase family protein [Parvularculaceae bacterium]|nr:type II CAAX endopeptidase family protein [Parvularculaceae bacterium]